MASSVRLHREVRLARLELTSPDGYPRLTISLLEALGSQLVSLLARPDCKGIVIHGTRNCFAAGAEISEVGSLTGLTALAFARRAQNLFESIAGACKPVVAAVTGYCLRGGFDLALACHRRFATPGAQFGHPGTTIGLLTGWGGTQRLPALLGRAAALQLLLTGEPIEAKDALRLGLVNEIVAAQALLEHARGFLTRHGGMN